MDIIIVAIIVAGAVIFSIRSFTKMYNGEGGCSCSTGCSEYSGCSCSSKDSCSSNFPTINKK